MKHIKHILLGVTLVTGAAFGADVPKYVFLFIGDGMSVPQRMIADEFSRKTRGSQLAMNMFPQQAITRTCSASSLVTDSAAAATAIACGTKTKNGSIGVDADVKRLESCAEVAQKAGRKVGVMSTVTITHATPAGFYGHRKSRGETYALAIDLADSGFDFFAGGGLDNKFNDTNDVLYAQHGNAYDYAARKGYRIVTAKDDFLALKPGCGKILTRFTDGALKPAIDADEKAEAKQPTLEQIVAKAIELLDNEKGFFIMAEGGRIDWAGHANDAATNLRDVLALDDAVKVALAFQEKHPAETLIVVTGDHETGGMSMGFAGTGYYLDTTLLSNQTISVSTFESKVARRYAKTPDMTFEDLKPLLTESFGFQFTGDKKQNSMVLDKNELSELTAAFNHDIELLRKKVAENKAYDAKHKYKMGGACRIILSHKCGISWGSGAHTAMPVLTTAKGCCADRFSGFIENCDIARKIKAFYSVK